MLSLFLHYVSSATTIAIDIGTESFKTTTVEDTRQAQMKDFPAYFALWNQTDKSYVKNDTWTVEDLNQSEWLFFNKAKEMAKTNPELVIRGFTPLADSQRGIPNKLIFTALLKAIYSSVATYSPFNPVIFTVPASMNRTDRFILQECSDLLALNLAAIVDQHTAMAAQFIRINASTFKDVTRNVMFLDIGAQKTWYTIFNFSSDAENYTETLNNGTEVIKTRYTPHGDQVAQETFQIGGDVLDQQFVDKLEDASGIENTTFYKQEAQRLKRLVTLDKPLEQQYFDPNFTLTIMPEELTIDPLVPTLAKIVEAAKLNDVNLIIMTGGTSQFPLVKEFFTAKEVGINITFIKNGLVTSDAAISNGQITGVNYFANCETYLEYNETKIKLTDIHSYSNETIKLNFTVGELTTFNITENGNILTSFSIVTPDFAEPDEIVELVFGIDVFSEPNIISAKYRGFPLDVYVNRPPWMLSEDEYEDSADFINAFDEVMKGRVLFKKAQRKKQKQLLEFMMKSNKRFDEALFNTTGFNITTFNETEFKLKIEERIRIAKEKARKENETKADANVDQENDNKTTGAKSTDL